MTSMYKTSRTVTMYKYKSQQIFIYNKLITYYYTSAGFYVFTIQNSCRLIFVILLIYYYNPIITI